MANGFGVPTGLSAPVAFQYPAPAARFGRDPFGYLRSRGEKKYHSFSPYSAIPAQTKDSTSTDQDSGTGGELRNLEQLTERRRTTRTWELPGVELVEIDLGDDGHGDGKPGAAPAEVVHHQLLVGRVEPEPRRQLQLLRLRRRRSASAAAAAHISSTWLRFSSGSGRPAASEPVTARITFTLLEERAKSNQPPIRPLSRAKGMKQCAALHGRHI